MRMHRPLQLMLVAGLALGAPTRAQAAPTTDAALTFEDTASVLRLARTTKARLRCTPVEPGAAPTPENVATAAEYGSIASMYAFAATHYPPEAKGDRVSQINDLVDEASLAYQSAYDCNPGLHSALHLHRAIDLLLARAQQLTPADERAQQFSTRIAQLQAKLPGPPPCPTCPDCPNCPTSPTPNPQSGYRGRYAERIGLGLGLGGGQTLLRGPSSATLDHFTLRLALGPRFVLGPRKRHILGTGLHYALHAILRVDSISPAHPSAIHQAGPYLEYAFAPLPKISLHANAGLQITAGVVALDPNFDGGRSSFHAFNLGGGAALCTLGTTLCARVQGHRSITRDSTGLAGYDVTLHLDFFRLADLLLDRRAQSKKG